MKKILILFGTRPEAIKLAPVIKALSAIKEFETIICSTGQHREMLRQVLDIFDLKIDYDLDLMKPNQDLYDITINTTAKLREVLQKEKPDLLIVQGDTSTAFVSSLAAFYSKVKIGHVEAGLRSYNIFSPYPEEANRRFISVLSDFNWAPTHETKENLIREGNNPKNIWVTGNTVVDALNEIKVYLNKPEKVNEVKESFCNILPEDFEKGRYILITLHRREKFGEEFRGVLSTFKEIAQSNPAMNFIYPVHLNPNVKGPVESVLKGLKNFYLLPPQDYVRFIYLMKNCFFIMTDSGGIQEECFTFKKPIMVLRDVTERNEAIKAGYAFLLGSSSSKIKSKFKEITQKLDSGHNYFSTKNPYGDGKSADRIVKILRNKL